MSRLVLSAAVCSALALSACASVNKQCFGDGVCRTETDGVVTWEGPPDKVEQRKGAEEAQKRMLAERDAAFAAAEKRPPTEPIRVAIVGPSAASPGVQSFVLQYRQMFLEAMQGDPRLQLVDAGKIAHLLKPSSSGMSSRSSGPPANVDEAMAKRVRDGGGEVDVLVVVTAKEKEKSGFVSGGGGSGMAQVVNVEFNASLSSVYAFAEQRHAEVGNSTAGMQMAGVDKSGKQQKADLKGTRDPSKDRAAIAELAGWVKQAVSGPVGASLPSLAAVQALNQQLKEQQAGQLMQLLGGQK